MSDLADADRSTASIGVISRYLNISFYNIEPIVAAIDIVVIVISSLLGGVGYQYFFNNSLGDIGTYVGFGIIDALVYVLLIKSSGLYRLPVLLAPGNHFVRIVLNWFVVLMMLILILFLLRLGTTFSRGSVITFVALGLVPLLGWRFVVQKYLRLALATGSIVGRRALIIGERDELAALGASHLLFQYGVKEVGRIILFDKDGGRLSESRNDLADLENATKLASQNGADEILIALRWSSTSLLPIIRDRLSASPLPVRLLPDHLIRTVLGIGKVSVSPSLSIELQRAPMTRAERVAKRAFDLILALSTIIVLSPLLAMTAIAIKLDSPGPVIFRQRRKGFNGREFVIFKFRTMKSLEDGPKIFQARKNDPRITTIGRLLRGSSIDELPQLLNVVKGDMSLVGPRPHAVAHDSEYKTLILKYANRHHVKPGITGWAQINGHRGETKRLEQMVERIDCDLWYIDNWSPWLDLRILVRTCFVLRSDCAY